MDPEELYSRLSSSLHLCTSSSAYTIHKDNLHNPLTFPYLSIKKWTFMCGCICTPTLCSHLTYCSIMTETHITRNFARPNFYIKTTEQVLAFSDDEKRGSGFLYPPQVMEKRVVFKIPLPWRAEGKCLLRARGPVSFQWYLGRGVDWNQFSDSVWFSLSEHKRNFSWIGGLCLRPDPFWANLSVRGAGYVTTTDACLA